VLKAAPACNPMPCALIESVCRCGLQRYARWGFCWLNMTKPRSFVLDLQHIPPRPMWVQERRLLFSIALQHCRCCAQLVTRPAMPCASGSIGIGGEGQERQQAKSPVLARICGPGHKRPQRAAFQSSLPAELPTLGLQAGHDARPDRILQQHEHPPWSVLHSSLIAYACMVRRTLAPRQ
jgi:hypothetical protein